SETHALQQTPPAPPAALVVFAAPPPFSAPACPSRPPHAVSSQLPRTNVAYYMRPRCPSTIIWINGKFAIITTNGVIRCAQM
ncbi:unnamed protein product, partial [Leptidea sinapis]